MILAQPEPRPRSSIFAFVSKIIGAISPFVIVASKPARIVILLLLLCSRRQRIFPTAAVNAHHLALLVALALVVIFLRGRRGVLTGVPRGRRRCPSIARIASMLTVVAE
jgi:hypothetical protein